MPKPRKPAPAPVVRLPYVDMADPKAAAKLERMLADRREKP